MYLQFCQQECQARQRVPRLKVCVHFPAQKEDLVNQARDNGAPEDVLDVLDKFSDRDYKSPIDIAREVPKAER